MFLAAHHDENKTKCWTYFYALRFVSTLQRWVLSVASRVLLCEYLGFFVLSSALSPSLTSASATASSLFFFVFDLPAALGLRQCVNNQCSWFAVGQKKWNHRKSFDSLKCFFFVVFVLNTPWSMQSGVCWACRNSTAKRKITFWGLYIKRDQQSSGTRQ